MGVGLSTYTDASGRVFDLRQDYQPVHINTADFVDVREEDNLRRSVLLQEQCGGQQEYLAIGKMKDHGWVNSSSLTYVTVQEKSLGSLYSLTTLGSGPMRIPGAAKLVAARAIGSVLETAESLYANKHLVISSLHSGTLLMRPDYSSAFLKDPLVFPEGSRCPSAGWPMFSKDNKCMLALVDSYVAGIRTFTEIIAPEAWSEAYHSGMAA